jgi:hypothetical protein
MVASTRPRAFRLAGVDVEAGRREESTEEA